jgi:osmotically-inducible protein OsmY
MFSNQRLLKSFSLLSIVFLAACVTPQQQTQANEYVEDSVITTKVKAAIFNEPTLKSAEINVETFKAVVQLSGFVNSSSDMNRAVEVTRGVTGVQSVKNDMRLK